MSTRIEWMGPPDIELHRRGALFHGYEEPVTEDLGLLIGDSNQCLMVEGTKEELLWWIDQLRAKVEAGVFDTADDYEPEEVRDGTHPPSP